MSEAVDSEFGSSLVTGHSSLDVYDDGLLRVEHENYYAACGGVALRLPRTEFLLLSRLARSAERVVRADELWRYAWGGGKPYNAESLHVHIYRLRTKLAPHRVRIETMVNVGYRLAPAADSSNGRAPLGLNDDITLQPERKH